MKFASPEFVEALIENLCQDMKPGITAPYSGTLYTDDNGLRFRALNPFPAGNLARVFDVHAEFYVGNLIRWKVGQFYREMGIFS